MENELLLEVLDPKLSSAWSDPELPWDWTAGSEPEQGRVVLRLVSISGRLLDEKRLETCERLSSHLQTSPLLD